VVDAFVHLADTLVVDYDIIDFLHYLIERCTDLIAVDEVGVMLASPSGHLQPVAASTERIRLLELFELQNQDGPCLDAFQTGDAVTAPDLEDERERWPNFAHEALQVGFRAAHSIPMRLRDNTIGAINLLRIETGDLSDEDTKLARALADIATIGVIHERTISQSSTTALALQHALTSRIRIEQAKGVLAERAGIPIDDAFELLRGYARRNQLGLTLVADEVVRGTLEIPR
jgi:transcriptional regulator with GAF, ATPase, and Fis domain